MCEIFLPGARKASEMFRASRGRGGGKGWGWRPAWGGEEPPTQQSPWWRRKRFYEGGALGAGPGYHGAALGTIICLRVCSPAGGRVRYQGLGCSLAEWRCWVYRGSLGFALPENTSTWPREGGWQRGARPEKALSRTTQRAPGRAKGAG